MTGDRLRELVAHATANDLPDPYSIDGIREMTARAAHRQQLDELAPALAVWALDAVDALEVIRETGYLDGHDELCSDDEPEYCDACAVLARFRQLGDTA